MRGPMAERSWALCIPNDAPGPYEIPADGFLIAYDLECTAWEGSLARNWTGPGELRELIEVGAVKLALEKGFPEVACFRQLVRPTINPVLSDYIIALTGITQDAVDRHGVTLEEAIRRFANFAGPEAPIVANGGDATWLLDECATKHIASPIPPGRFVNIRATLVSLLGITKSQCTTSRLPEFLGLPPIADAHTGLGDARALATALRMLRAQGRL